MTTGPWNISDWSPEQPALVGVATDDPSAAATLCKLLSLPPVGQVLDLRVASARTGQFDFQWAIQPVDSILNATMQLAYMINQNGTLAANYIGAQYSPGTNVLGVSNHGDNLAVVTPMNWQECWSISPGGTNLDAWPVYMLRLPKGFVPPNGSNIAQLSWNSTKLGYADHATVTYGMVSVNIENNDPATGIRGRTMIATPDNTPAGLPKNRITAVEGVAIGDAQPAEHGSLTVDSIIMAGRRFIIGSDGIVRAA